MAKVTYKNGVSSVILRVKLLDTASAVGAGKTGLGYNSTGLVISTIADVEAVPAAYTQAAGTIESITTLGIFQAPSPGKCRFKEVDATRHPGLYEIQIADARWAVSGARSIIITVSGASGMAQVDAEIQLADVPATLDGEEVELAASQPHYAPAKAGDAMTLTEAERNSIADAVLVRDVSHGEASAGDHSLCYVVLAMSESNTTAHANKLTVFRSDGTTEFAQKTITTSASANPVTGVS